MTKSSVQPHPLTALEAPVRTTAVVTRPLAYAWRMAAFLAVVGIVIALLHEEAFRFFQRNPPLNGLILSVLGLGLVLSFRSVLSLDPEVSWIRRFHGMDPELPSDDPPPLLGPLATLLRDRKGRLSLTATGMRSVLDGVDSRLDERRETLRYLIALLIFLGLLGTFWGLLMTANSVGETIRSLNVTGSDPAQIFQTLRAGLEAPLSGMGTAFSTSLFGLASSLVLGFLDLQASQAQNRFANEVESWLTGLTQAAGAASTDDDGVTLSYTHALLDHTAERFDELRARIDQSIEHSSRTMSTLRALGERIVALTDELRATKVGGTDTQQRMLLALQRIADATEGPSGAIDDVTRAHIRSLDLAVERLLVDGAQGRDHVVAEIRNELRLLARTLSVIADRGR
jgi:hypothetical protein